MKLILLMVLAATQLLELYPNPYGSDEAEYIKFHCDSSCILTDGEGRLEVGEGTYVAAKNLTHFQQRFGYEADVPFPPHMALSNNGEEICLNEDCFYYGKDLSFLDEGVIYYRTQSGWDFRYEDWSSFSCLNETLEGELIITPADFTLDDGWIVASYTFHAPFTPSKLFVDGKDPTPCRELEENTIFLKSPSYKNFHYKFALRGDKVVITTENWQFNKKGFIVTFESKNVSIALLNLLENDEKYSSSQPESCSNWVYVKGEGGKSLHFKAPVTFFILPDCNPILDLISSCRQRLYIIAPYIDFKWYKSGGLLDSILQARNQGAEVKVILNSQYASPESVETLRKEGIDVFLIEKLHGKAIVSDDRLLITTANMNMYGLKLNREIGLILHSKEAAD